MFKRGLLGCLLILVLGCLLILGSRGTAAFAAHPSILKPQLSPAPIRPQALLAGSSAFVPQQGVTLVPPTAVPVSSTAGTQTTPTSAPPKAPALPSAPNAPTNDSPISFGGALSGPTGLAIFFFAALAAILSIIPPWLTSRVATAVTVPVEYRRRLSLERPG